MIWAALRQAAKTYAVGAALLRFVQLVDEALDSPAPASPPEPPAPANLVVEGELVEEDIGAALPCQCGHTLGEHDQAGSWCCSRCSCPGFALYVNAG